ncbi:MULTISPECIES: LCP family protein [unclassified Kitasatospora]|uniref:LCP family protein n=1 Tax=unclassified Kitasatospora TaxID=2633591 RepID=UPI0024754B95|nr:LCP family protein [Kitasatospora sp. MAP12-44]
MTDERPEPPAAGGGKRRHRALRWLVLSLGLLLVLLAAGGGWVYLHLDGNVRHSPLYLGSGSPGTETKNGAGQSPLNILVIGSDTRATAADCAIGGDCGPGANADVEMLVHLSAGRTSATVMSIPRDTVVDIPQCTDPKTGHVYPAVSRALITSSLQNGGPGCTVAAVHALTGIPVDHFALVDFSGVVSMSDTIGGVSVCVDNNIYDPYSQLKLAKGTHSLKGLAALEFLRTRHGFGDGGDLGREAAQHVFLSSLVQKLKSANTLTNPIDLYDLADAATKALTVDDGLGGITNLVALASQLNDVLTAGITFTTMPTLVDPGNADWLVPTPAAQAVFRAIAADQALPDDTASATPQAAAMSPTADAGGAPPSGAQLLMRLMAPAAPAAPMALAAQTPPARTLNAAAAPGCVAVGTQDTTPFGSPIAAYALNPQIPDSAP